MEFLTAERIGLFLAVFMPGFVSIKVYDMLIPGEQRDFSKSVLEVVGYSVLNYAALFWLVALLQKGHVAPAGSFWYYVVWALVVLLVPSVWPVVVIKLRTWQPLARHLIHPVLKPWDYVFGKKEGYWVIVHQKDGRRIGGKYGAGSFASSYPAPEQIYLEELWQLDATGKFTAAVTQSRGAVISCEDVEAVEFFSLT